MNMQTEPSIIIGAVGALITAAVPLLAKTFGWTDELASEWETMLQAAWIVLGMVITALAIRMKVWSPASVAKIEGGNGPADPS